VDLALAADLVALLGLVKPPAKKVQQVRVGDRVGLAEPAALGVDAKVVEALGA